MAAYGEIFEIKAQVYAVILGEYKRAKEILAKQLPKGVSVKYSSPKDDSDIELWGQRKIGQMKMIDWYGKRKPC